MIISLTEPNHYFEQAMELYKSEFPSAIREDKQVFLESFKVKQQDSTRYYFLCTIQDEQVTGFITFHYEKQYSIGYIVYLVVNPAFRGQHIAVQLMNEANQIMNKAKYIMLECEKDSDGNSPLDQFYSKFGFEKADYTYVQPGLQGGHPVPMNLYVKGTMDESLRPAVAHIYRVKYSETNHINPKLLEEYINHF